MNGMREDGSRIVGVWKRPDESIVDGVKRDFVHGASCAQTHRQRVCGEHAPHNHQYENGCPHRDRRGRRKTILNGCRELLSYGLCAVESRLKCFFATVTLTGQGLGLGLGTSLFPVGAIKIKARISAHNGIRILYKRLEAARVCAPESSVQFTEILSTSLATNFDFI